MKDIVITSFAKNAVVVANTPSFLLRKLRMDSSIRHAVDTSSQDELLEAAKSKLQVPAASPESLVEQYVYLVAFSLASSAELWSKRHELNVESMPWGKELIALIHAERSDSFMPSSRPTISKRHAVSSTSSWGQSAKLPPAKQKVSF